MISIRTNHRSEILSKDYSKMSNTDLVTEYNARSGKPPIKRFATREAGVVRLQGLDNPNPTPTGTANVLSDFGVRDKSNRAKLVNELAANIGNQVPLKSLLSAVYGNQNIENKGALVMVMKGAINMITKGRLNYTIKREKSDKKEISYGLYKK